MSVINQVAGFVAYRHFWNEKWRSTAGRVTTLIDDMRGAGPHETQWDGTDATGASVSSGVYFYRMTAGKTSLSKRMMLLK